MRPRLTEPDPRPTGAGRGRRQDHLVAVLEEGPDSSATGRTGSVPPQVSSMKAPRVSFSGPEMVPEANRSPVRVEAPFTVRCASIWAGDQYISRYGGRLTLAVPDDREVDVQAPRLFGAR